MNDHGSKCKTTVTALILGIFCAIFCGGTAHADTPKKPQSPGKAKYIFYFIGDGMASPQIHATEAYLAALKKKAFEPMDIIKADSLVMRKFPAQGMQTSFANNRFITGSAAAGTALACGKKTNIGVISMDPDAKIPYGTLAEAAKKKGLKVGIVSSVSIDHATPAVFYAHTDSRNNYEEIGRQLLESEFDYFAGGGFRVNKYDGAEYQGKTDAERYAMVEKKATAQKFTFANTRAEFDALKPDSGRVIAVNPYLDSSNALPYALNRKGADGKKAAYEGSITLAEFTQKGIELLDNDKGFFMMVEGGKIDWACHANDARAAIEETIAFDEAVGTAVKFAQKHPGETLIAVTGDHECGGMTLGFAGTAYDTYYDRLTAQVIAYDDFDDKIFAAYQKSHHPAPKDIDAKMWRIIFDNFGMDGSGLSADKGDDLTAYEIGLLEKAFDQAMKDKEISPEDEENSVLYGSYNPLSVTLTHVINRKSGLAWTSYSHTAVPVPVLAMGIGAEIFNGYYDNTDVPKKIADVMQVTLAQK